MVVDEEDGYRGAMSDLALTDILALLCLCERTVLLHLNHKGRRGRIEVVDGAIVHGEFTDITGPEAIWTMLGLRQGDIFMQGEFTAVTPTVTISWQKLLSDAAAWIEENPLPEEPEEEVDIPVEGWDDDFSNNDEDAKDGDPNPLGFSEDDLREMRMAEEELPHQVTSPAASPPTRENTLPRAPRLGPSSQMGTPAAPAQEHMRRSPTPPWVPTDTMGKVSMSLDEVVHTLADEIPHFVAADIVQVEDSTSIAGIVASETGGYDNAAAAAFYGELIRTASKASSAFGESPVATIQITTAMHYVLVRVVPNTAFAQLVVMHREGNLGIARVVMRRLDNLLNLAVPH